MSDEVGIILKKLNELPKINACRKSIVILSNNNVNLSAQDFDKAVEYIWENELIKIIKVEHEYKYIIKIYADIS